MNVVKGLTDTSLWRSPVRGRRFTAVLGLVLLIGLPVLFVTGLLSYAAYNPNLGGENNDRTPDKGILGFYLFDWPTDPTWLYSFTQGLHVILGLALVPMLLAKLWSVIPRLFAWPPIRSFGHAIERLSLILVVGGGIFEFVTGILNIQYWYVFPVGFYTAHFYGAWVFVGGLLIHIVVKFPLLVAGLRSRVDPAAPEPDDLAAPAPDPPSISRRGALAMIGGSSLLVTLMSVGQATGGPLRNVALLAPQGIGKDFPVNRTADEAGVKWDMTGDDWQLVLLGGAEKIRLTRSALLALPQYTERLPIACVEGWTTTQEWTGVRLRDLAMLAGIREPTMVFVESLQRRGSFGTAKLRGNQILDDRSLLALAVNGADLTLNHGFPARVIVPNNPGVHNTKWVARMTFRS